MGFGSQELFLIEGEEKKVGNGEVEAEVVITERKMSTNLPHRSQWSMKMNSTQSKGLW